MSSVGIYVMIFAEEMELILPKCKRLKFQFKPMNLNIFCNVLNSVKLSQEYGMAKIDAILQAPVEEVRNIKCKFLNHGGGADFDIILFDCEWPTPYLSPRLFGARPRYLA